MSGKNGKSINSDLAIRYEQSIKFANELIDQPGWNQKTLFKHLNLDVDRSLLSRYVNGEIKISTRSTSSLEILQAIEKLRFAVGPLLRTRSKSEVFFSQISDSHDPEQMQANRLYIALKFLQEPGDEIERIHVLRSYVPEVLSYSDDHIELGISRLLITLAVLLETQVAELEALVANLLDDVLKLLDRYSIVGYKTPIFQERTFSFAGVVEFKLGTIANDNELRNRGLNKMADVLKRCGEEQFGFVDNFLNSIAFLQMQQSNLAPIWVSVAAEIFGQDELKRLVSESQFAIKLDSISFSKTN